MKIRIAELRSLLELLRITECEELDCEQFLAFLPGYVEKLQRAEALVVDGYREFLHHLKMCPGCEEEFEVLNAAMRDGAL